MQTNKQSGQNTISIVNSQHPTLPLVSLTAGGSVNHKTEAAAVQFGYYSLISPDSRLFSLALDRCISLLKNELAQGHMLGELLTDSHAPIHLRAWTSLQLYILTLRTKRAVIPQGAVSELSDLLARWFESHIALLSLGLVPSGPLQGAILLPCSRKRGATRKDAPRDTSNPMLCSQGNGWVPKAPYPGDPVREAFLSMVAGRSPLPRRLPSVHPKSTHLGKAAQILSIDSQDTAAVPITRLIQSKGGFGPNVMRGSLPKLIAPNFKVTFYQDGHWARFGGTGEGSRARAGEVLGVDSVTSLWVQYSSGKFSFLDPSVTPHPFTGGSESGKVIGEVSWDERGEPK